MSDDKLLPLPQGVETMEQLESWLREKGPKKKPGKEKGPRKLTGGATSTSCIDPEGPVHDLVDLTDKQRRRTFKFDCPECHYPLIVMSNLSPRLPTTRVEKGDIVRCDQCGWGIQVDAVNPDTTNPGVKLQVTMLPPEEMDRLALLDAIMQ